MHGRRPSGGARARRSTLHARPSPASAPTSGTHSVCDDWTVRELVNHVVSGNYWAFELAGGRTIEEVGDRLDGDVLGTDPLRAYDDSRSSPPRSSGSRARWTAVRGVVRAGSGLGVLRPPVHRRARPRLGRRRVDRAGHHARPRARGGVLGGGRAAAGRARRQRRVRRPHDAPRRRRPADPPPRCPGTPRRSHYVSSHGSAHHRHGGRGCVAVGADLRPQPLDHRDGDRALPVGRGGEGRTPARRARPPAVRPRRRHGHRVLELRHRDRAAGALGRARAQVVETIENLFGYYGDDAGWSPDNLRAIGVEPLPTPEPTA